MGRENVTARLQSLVGPSVLEIEDPGQRWPALGVVHLPDTSVQVALWLSTVIRSHREKDLSERRFENPRKDRPIVVPTGRLPLLIGVWADDPLMDVPAPVIVAADARRREGKATRFSVFQPLDALRTAATAGWETRESTSGELLTYFHPALFAAFVAAEHLGVPLRSDEVRVGAVEVVTAAADVAEERKRRVTTTLVRCVRFRRAVLRAYSGRCAMCELGLGLVESAHIFPAAAEGSQDHVWNGVALCPNHHAALDAHLVWVNPATREIRIHPSIRDAKGLNRAHASFVDDTRRTLTEPLEPGLRPLASMFAQRYSHYAGRYDWALS